MKVVINRCFGGFGISIDALYELMKRKAKCVEKMKIEEYYGDNKEKYYEELKRERIIDFKDGFKKDNWLTSTIYDEHYVYSLTDRYENKCRTDKDLIDIVTLMGEKAYGDSAELKIVEIPDDVKWHIEEYDGMEHIAEDHQTWE